jgi:hypothetical protein
MKMIHWWRPPEPQPPKGEPYVAMIKSFDIPATIAACIRNAAPGIVAIALCRRGGREMIEAATKAAEKRKIRVIWWNGPEDHSVPREERADPVMLTAMTHQR